MIVQYAPLSLAYQMPNNNLSDTPVPFRKYTDRLKKYEPKLHKNLIKIAQATGIIMGRDGSLNGHAILVTRTTAFVPAHGFDEDNHKLWFLGGGVKARVLFDGTNHRLDFKWVELPNLGISPPRLTASMNVGSGLQLSYNDNLKLNVVPFESDDSCYMTRSHAGGISYEGESGSPRVDVTSEAIESMLQGSGEGLSMNTIFHTIKRFCTQSRQIRLINEIYDQFVDPQGLYMYSNTNPIQMGCVEEHAKKGLSLNIIRKANIFTENFLEKHYARSKEEAEKKTKALAGKVTVIKITSEAALQSIIEQAKAKLPSITAPRGWDFINGELKKDKQNPTIGVGYSGQKICHLDFMT